MTRIRIEASTPTTLTIEGRRLLAFAGCNYLGLAQHPEVLDAARAGLSVGTVSPGASRETSGNYAIYEELEEGIARFLGVEAALLMTDGYLADLATVQGLAQTTTAAFIDPNAHPSLVDAARAARLEVSPLPPVLPAHTLYLSDGAYPVHGSVTDLARLLAKLPSDGYALIDESHTFGVLGATGRGLAEHVGASDTRLVRTASLSKALGGGGGFVAGSAQVIERVRGAGAYIGTTPIAPALAAAGTAALRILGREPERVARLAANAERLHALVDRTQLGGPASLLPVRAFAPPALGAAAARAALDRAGIYVPFMEYPGDPKGGVFRLAVTSEHTDEEFARLALALEALA